MDSRLLQVFENQGLKQAENRLTPASVRKEKLRKLKSCLESFEPKIMEALKVDLNKNAFEASVTELFYLYGEIDFAIKHLNSWMSPKSASKVLSNFFSKNKIHYEPKGRALIISPWNYPLQLALSPLISAIAAGNCVMLKPSELSPKTSEVIDEIIKACFAENEVACFLGGQEVSQDLLALPFDHIFFTGSTAVGKIVMEAAAKNLSSVTLELGGKSPVIITESADLEASVLKIAWGKLVNAGQTCIAPDYVLLPASELDKFIGLYQKAIEQLYPVVLKNPEYGKIINEYHFNRIKVLVEEALAAGARIPIGGEMNASKRIISPVLMTEVPTDNNLLNQEIFGPVLPVVTYTDPAQAINFVLSKPKPLALYIFADKKSETDYFLNRIPAGGVCVNDVLVHFSNPNLPFGGANHSGLGSSHGFHGFKAFSHEKSVVFQSKISFNYLVYPPFSSKSWVLKVLRKIF